MRHRGSATQTAISVAMWPLIIVFAPVILVAGEPVNRYVMRRVRWGPATVTRPAGGVVVFLLRRVQARRHRSGR